MSKLEEGKVENSPEEINLKLFISDIISEMQTMTTNNQKIIQHHTGNEIAFLDKKSLKNILFNLISNAIKFTRESGSIEITSAVSDGNVKIVVADNGIGISQEDQKHLFERFFRAHNATHIQGTGLGLNIVGRYVELMKGSIHFESEENKGTAFTIHIPQ